MFSAVFLPMFMAAVDQTLLATATPVIATELGGLRDTSWIAVAYLLAAAAAVPLYGWAGDRFGLARILRWSLGLFSLGSLVCGAALSLPMLVAARALQGLGGGGLMTLSQAMIGELLPPRERARFQGYFAAVFTLAAVGGPVLGGLVVTHMSWRVLFWINLPLAAFAVWRLHRLKHPAPAGRAEHAVDGFGLVLFPVCVVCAIFWLSAVGHRFAWRSPPSIALVLIVLTGMLVLLHHERRHSQPFLDLELLSQPAIRAALICTAVFASCMFALVFFLPIYMQLFLKSSAVKSGLLMLPLSSGIVFGATLGGRAMALGVPPKWVPATGLMVSALSLGLLAWLGAEPKMIASLGVLTGLGFGTVMPTTQIIVQTVAGRGRLATATSLASLSRSIGAAAGTTVFGALIFSLLPSLPVGASAEEFLTLPPTDIQIAFHLVFALMAITCAAGSVVAARAPVVRI